MQTAASAPNTSVTKYTVRSKSPTCANPVLNGTIKRKAKSTCTPVTTTRRLAGHLLQIRTIQTLKARLPAPRGTGATLAIGVWWLSVAGHHQFLPAPLLAARSTAA